MAHKTRRFGVHLRRLEPEEWIERDLTQAALGRELRPAIDVDAPLAQLVEHLLAPGGDRHPVLVGPPGSGKTTVITELARRAALGTLPLGVDDAHIVRLSLRSVAGRMAPQEDRLDTFERLLDRIDNAHPRRILFIEDLHVAHEQGWVDPILRFLARTHQPVFLEARRSGFERLLAQHDAAGAFLFPIEVHAPGRDRLRAILQAWAANHEGLAVDVSAIHLAADLARRYLANDGAPRRALALLRQAVELQPESRTEPIGPSDVVDCFVRITRLPRTLVDPASPLDLDHFAAGLRSWLPGQDPAVHSIVETVALLKAGLARPDRAAGSFLFAGPAGSGRGRCADLLADEVFGGPSRLLRIDLSRYADDAGTRELLGDPRAASRRDRQGLLGSMVARQPCGVLHLAHAEAASDDVLRALAAALARGTWIDGVGDAWALSGLIVIITVDAHTATPLSRFDRSAPRLVDPAHADGTGSLDFLPSDLLRSVDRVVGFRDQRGKSSRALVRRALDELVVRMGKAVPHLAVDVDDGALDWLADRLSEAGQTADADVQGLVESHVASAVAVYLVSAGSTPAMPVQLTLRDGRIRAQAPARRPARTATAAIRDPHVAQVRLWWADDTSAAPTESAWLLLESTDGADGSRWLMDLLGMYRRWLTRHGAELTIVGEWVAQGQLRRIVAEASGDDVLALLSDEAGEHHHLSRQGAATGACVTVVERGASTRSPAEGTIVPLSDAEGFLVTDPGHRLHLDLARPEGALVLRGADAELLRQLSADVGQHFAAADAEPRLARLYDEQAGLAIDPCDNRSTTELRAVLAGALDAFRVDNPTYDLQIEDETVELYPVFRRQMVQ